MSGEVAAGTPYDELARLSIRTTTGRSASMDERRREVDRLRQIVGRHRMTARHDIRSCKVEVGPSIQARSDRKDAANQRRTATDQRDDDDLDGSPDDETEQPPRRRGR